VAVSKINRQEERLMRSDFSKVIAAYSPLVRMRLKALRHLVLDAAAKTDGVGRIEEALKWGQPSFLTSQTKSGSTIRIDGLRNEPEKYAMYFHCQTGLINVFREQYAKALTYDGNRALIFDVNEKLPTEILSHCISLALTHHLRKKSMKARI
jgi:Domain of unknown function (DU1801)